MSLVVLNPLQFLQHADEHVADTKHGRYTLRHGENDWTLYYPHSPSQPAQEAHHPDRATLERWANIDYGERSGRDKVGF